MRRTKRAALAPGKVVALNRAYYDREVKRFAAAAAKRGITSLRDLLARALPRGARILDAGCGTGADALAFQKHGLRVTAIDASAAMVAYCRRQGIAARQQTFQQITARHRYDAAWVAAALIHVPEREISSVLQRLARALRPGAWIYISLWNGKDEGITREGRFICRYTKARFGRLLQITGEFLVIRAWLDPIGTAGAPRWLHFIAHRR
jgi:2-polyprenyl-3-methyl-5-hydroxy-6-metoxy-1,4-benzoquinol methylase